MFVRKDGRGGTYTYLTDEKALELLTAGIRIRPMDGAAALVRQLRGEVADA
jgi:hypothetical protein